MENSIRYLKILLDDYKFNPQTLADYLSVKVNDVYAITNKNMTVFNSADMQNQAMNKINELYFFIQNNNDTSTKKLIENAMSDYKINVETIALISKVNQEEIKTYLENQKDISESDQLKILTTVSSLINQLSNGGK